MSLFSACGNKESASAEVPPATNPEPGIVMMAADSPMLAQIKREKVATKELPNDEVIAPGKIEANPNRVSKVVLPVTGRIVSVMVKMGDAVHKDQPLLSIQSPDADAAMSAYLSAQAGLTQNRAALAKAQSDFDRASDLFAHNAVAKKDVQGAESALAQGKAGVEQAQASLDQALRRLAVLGLKPGDSTQEVVVRSPLAGKVLELSVVPGEFRNDTSASLMTIADLSSVWVTSQVPESYIRFVQLGERVEISLVAYPGEKFDGRVSRIADTLDPNADGEGAGRDGQPRGTLPPRDVRQHSPRRVHVDAGGDSVRRRRAGWRSRHRVRRAHAGTLRRADGVARQAIRRRRARRERRAAGRVGGR